MTTGTTAGEAQPGDAGDAGDAGRPEPGVGLRLVVTQETTRRIDVLLGAQESVAVEHGVSTSFPTERLWPEVRDRLPDLAPLRSDPRGRTDPPVQEPGAESAPESGPEPGPEPGPESGSWRAHVVVATVVTGLPQTATPTVGPQAGQDRVVAVRTWLATDDELWQVTAGQDGPGAVRLSAEGALGDLLIWDVTGAFEALTAAVARGGARP